MLYSVHHLPSITDTYLGNCLTEASTREEAIDRAQTYLDNHYDNGEYDLILLIRDEHSHDEVTENITLRVSNEDQPRETLSRSQMGIV